ncbi:MAG: tetratricopeptide repeat protein [Bradymonadales bacterium]|nr:tetratricopeptide repeat protein [Bradymonadales bacterium]
MRSAHNGPGQEGRPFGDLLFRRPIAPLGCLLLLLAWFLPSGSTGQTVERLAEQRHATGTGIGIQASDADAGELGPSEILGRAIELFLSGEPEQAGELIDRAVAANPQASALALHYARELGNRQRFDEAIAFLRHHLEMVPGNYRAAVELGVLLSTLLEHDEAARYFAMVPPEAGQVFLPAHLNLGRSLRLAGRFEEAYGLYLGLLEGADAALAESALCEIELARGELSACRARLAEARGRLGQNVGFDRIEASLLYLEGEIERSAERVRDLFQSGRSTARIAMLQVLLPLAQGRLEQAQQAVDALHTANVLGEIPAIEAIIAMMQGDLDLASERYLTALDRNPLFRDPARTARILLWRPELAAALESVAQAARKGAQIGTGPIPAPTPSSASPEGMAERSPSQGCCNSLSMLTQPAHPMVVLPLLLLLLYRTTRSHPGRSKGRPGGANGDAGL